MKTLVEDTELQRLRAMAEGSRKFEESGLYENLSAQTAGYTRDSDGWVTIRGVVGGGSSGTVIFQLPAGFRPTKFEAFPVVTNTGYGVVTVDTSGNVSHNAGGTTNVYMTARFRVT